MEAFLTIMLVLGIYIVAPALIGLAIVGVAILSARRARARTAARARAELAAELTAKPEAELGQEAPVHVVVGGRRERRG